MNVHHLGPNQPGNQASNRATEHTRERTEQRRKKICQTKTNRNDGTNGSTFEKSRIKSSKKRDRRTNLNDLITRAWNRRKQRNHETREKKTKILRRKKERTNERIEIKERTNEIVERTSNRGGRTNEQTNGVTKRMNENVLELATIGMGDTFRRLHFCLRN